MSGDLDRAEELGLMERRTIKADHKDKVRWFVTERGEAALAAEEIPAKPNIWLARASGEHTNSEAPNNRADPDNASQSDSADTTQADCGDTIQNHAAQSPQPGA